MQTLTSLFFTTHRTLSELGSEISRGFRNRGSPPHHQCRLPPDCPSWVSGEPTHQPSINAAPIPHPVGGQLQDLARGLWIVRVSAHNSVVLKELVRAIHSRGAAPVWGRRKGRFLRKSRPSTEAGGGGWSGAEKNRRVSKWVLGCL